MKRLMVVAVLVLVCWLLTADSRAFPRIPAVVRMAEVRWANPDVRRLVRIARCETGYLAGRRVNWRHHNSTYSGGLGFAWSTWSHYKRHVRPEPRARYARDATVRQQLAVGLVLRRVFHGWSSWPACSRRLGLR